MTRSIRAKNKVEYKIYLDRDLKNAFKQATIDNNTNMAKEITAFIESYLAKHNKESN